MLWEGVKKQGDFSQMRVVVVADSQTRSKPLKTITSQNHPENRLFRPGFHLSFSQISQKPWGGWVFKHIWERSPKNIFFFFGGGGAGGHPWKRMFLGFKNDIQHQWFLISCTLYKHASKNNQHKMFRNQFLKGAPIKNCWNLHLGIAQTAIGPPPALNRALWGTFFRANLTIPQWCMVPKTVSAPKHLGNRLDPTKNKDIGSWNWTNLL